jgi:hypothetical protein
MEKEEKAFRHIAFDGIKRGELVIKKRWKNRRGRKRRWKKGWAIFENVSNARIWRFS